MLKLICSDQEICTYENTKPKLKWCVQIKQIVNIHYSTFSSTNFIYIGSI